MMPSDHGGRPAPVTPGRPSEWDDRAAAELKERGMRLAELRPAVAYPNLAERIIRAVRDVLASIALLLAILTFILGLRLLSAVGQAINDIKPDPAVTGCPFGEGQCGG